MSLYPQAPLSVGKVLDAGFTMYRATFKQILPLTFVAVLVSQVPQLVPYLMAGAAPGMGGIPGLSAGFVAGLLVWLVVDLAFYAGWIKSLDAVARGGAPLGVGAAFSAGLPKVLWLLIATILFTLALIIGCVLLVVPGLILMVSLIFFSYLVVLEDKSPFASLTASHSLVWGSWWRTLAVITVGGVVYFVVILVVVGTAGAVVGISTLKGPTPEQAAAGVTGTVLVVVALQVVMVTLLFPMWNSLMLVLLRDLQLRKAAPAGSS